MSEKKAKEQRKTQQKIVYQMTIQLIDLDGRGENFSVRVKDIPLEFNHAMGMLTDAMKAVSHKFLQAAMTGQAGTVEPSRIIPAHALPPGGYGRA